MEKAGYDDYVELSYEYDNLFVKEQDERLKNVKENTILATQVCIQHISNLMKRLSK